MELLKLARKYEDYIISMRRYLHENPEEYGKDEYSAPNRASRPDELSTAAARIS